MVRLKTTDDLCCELSLSATSYNLKGINLSNLENNFNVKVTSLDITNTSEEGTPSTTAVYLHNRDVNAHGVLFEAITQKNEEQDILISQKVNTEDLSNVATSGDYADLINTPDIPTKTSELTNDSNFITADNELINNKVSKTGDTMSGPLLINVESDINPIQTNCGSGNSFICIKNTNDSTTSSPSVDQIRGYRILNSDDTILGDVRFMHFTNGTVSSRLVSRNYATGSAITAQFGIDIDINGNISLYMPTSIKNQLASLAMPSQTTQAYSIGASSSTYTAPSNGWFNFVFRTSAVGDFIGITNVSKSSLSSFQSGARVNQLLRVFIPAEKEDVVRIEYSASSTNTSSNSLTFIYAIGG